METPTRRGKAAAVMMILAMVAVGGCGGDKTDDIPVPPDNKGYMVEDWGLDDPSAKPLDVVVAPDGAAWSTVPDYRTPEGSFPGRLARTTPQGSTTYVDLPDGDMGFAEPMRMVLGPDDALWFTDFRNNRIGRSTLDGDVTFYPIPEPGGEPVFIANGPDGAVWFTTQVGHQVGKITMTGAMTVYDVGAVPAGITSGPDGNIWFALFREAAIGRISTDGALGNPIPLPADAEPVQIIAVGKGAMVTEWSRKHRLYVIGEDESVSTYMTDGQPLWIAPDPNRGVAWVALNMAIFGVQQFALDGPRRKYEVVAGTFVQDGGIAVGPDGSLWLAEYNLARVGRMQFHADPTLTVYETGNSAANGLAFCTSGYLWIGLGNPIEGIPGAIGRMGLDGSLTTFEVEAGTRPYQAVADPHGKVWFTDIGPSIGEKHNRVLSVEPGGAVTYHHVGFAPFGITLGSDDAIWVTAEQEDITENQIARIDPIDHSMTFYSLPDETNTWGATTGSDGAVWFLGRTAAHDNWVLGRITPAGDEIDLFEIPETLAHLGTFVPSVVFGASSGQIWIGDLERRLNVFTLETREFSGWIGAGNPPGAMAEAADGSIWYAGFGGGVSRIAPDGLRSGRGVNAGQQVGIALGPDGSVWFTDMQTGFVTRHIPR